MGNKNWDNNWLVFSKRTRRGIFVLIILFILIAILPRIYHNYIDKSKSLEVVNNSIVITNKIDDFKVDEESESSVFMLPDEKFNPNEYSLQEWMQIGFSEKQAQVILNYKETIDGFKSKEDVKKLYVMSDELFDLLEPKIDLPNRFSGTSTQHEKGTSEQIYEKETLNKSAEGEVKEKSKNVKDEEFVISINTASDKELQRINGIGPFFSSEIIKMRKLWGGIATPNQLLNIYNMDEEKLEQIVPYLLFDEKEINKLDINTASLEKLKSHPLISADLARSIIYFRENYHPFNSLDELLLLPYINQKSLKELSPFIKLN